MDLSDLSPGSGTLSRLFDDPGVSLSILNLMELMLLISDNSATDLCLKTAGGGERVTARMTELGVEGVRVARSTADLITDYVGAEGLPPRSERTRATYTEYYGEVSEEDRAQARDSFEADARDTATPRGMGDLLVKIWNGEGLSKESRDLLIDIMERCETGAGRLKGRLPEGTVVAHKTGTIGRTTNDVGIVYLPSDAGHVVMVAFVKESDDPVPDRERAIAEAAPGGARLLPVRALREGRPELGAAARFRLLGFGAFPARPGVRLAEPLGELGIGQHPAGGGSIGEVKPRQAPQRALDPGCRRRELP